MPKYNDFDNIRNVILLVFAIISFLGGMYAFIYGKDLQISNNSTSVASIGVVVEKVIPQVQTLSNQVNLIAQSVDNNAVAINKLGNTTEQLVINVAVLEERVKALQTN